MADDVNVKFGADVAGLIAGCRQAQDAMKGFVNQTKSSLESLTAPFAQLQRMMLGIAAIAGGGYLFKSFVDTATAAASETLKLQKSLGITAAEANVLRVALHGTGNTVDDYVQASLKLDRQVRQSEDAIKRTGMATRDTNGQLLDGQRLMTNAISTVRQYKEGTDRNIVSQILFGRGAGETASLLKLSSEAMTRAARDAQELGLAVTPEAAANARAYKDSMNQLELTFMGIKKAIGEAVLPYLTRFAQWFREQGPSIISNMKQTVKTVIEWAFDAAEGLIKFAGTVADAVFNLYTIYLYLKTKTGDVTEAQAHTSLDALDTKIEQLKQLRQKAIEGLQSLKATVTTGGPTNTPAPASPASGDKGATDLLKFEERRKAALLAVDGEIRAERRALEEKKTIYEADAANLKITEDQKYALIMTASDREYQRELELLDKKKRIAGSDLATRQQVENAIADLKSRHRIEQLQLDQQSIQSMKSKYLEVFNEIQSAFSSQLRGLLAGTTSFAQAFKAILGDLIIAFINMCARMAMNWAAAELARTTATTSGVAARTAAEETGAIASLAMLIPKILKAIAAFAAETFGGVFAFLAPVMGPAAAGPAAASAGVVAAAGAAVSAYEVGAWNIPGEQLAMLHPKEAVLPAGAADAFRSFASGGFQQGGHTVNVSFAANGRMTASEAKGHARTIAQEIVRMLPTNPSLKFAN